MGSIYMTAAPSEAVLAYAILQFCINNVYSVYFNVPSSKAIRQNSIKVKQRQLMYVNMREFNQIHGP